MYSQNGINAVGRCWLYEANKNKHIDPQHSAQSLRLYLHVNVVIATLWALLRGRNIQACLAGHLDDDDESIKENAQSNYVVLQLVNRSNEQHFRVRVLTGQGFIVVH